MLFKKKRERDIGLFIKDQRPRAERKKKKER
jgi:hypothetical protein